jgi:4-hydroxybenzoyl-CoA thioesterase
MPPFVFTTPVRFADVDHAGIVYYPRYFHYFHMTFEELWRQRLGARAYVELLDRDHIGFPAVHAECDFKAPLRFGDDAQVELSVAKLGGSSIHFHYRVLRKSTPELESVVCATGKVICAVVDLQSFKAVASPTKVVELLANLND